MQRRTNSAEGHAMLSSLLSPSPMGVLHPGRLLQLSKEHRLVFLRQQIKLNPDLLLVTLLTTSQRNTDGQLQPAGVSCVCLRMDRPPISWKVAQPRWQAWFESSSPSSFSHQIVFFVSLGRGHFTAEYILENKLTKIQLTTPNTWKSETTLLEHWKEF